MWPVGRVQPVELVYALWGERWGRCSCFPHVRGEAAVVLEEGETVASALGLALKVQVG